MQIAKVNIMLKIYLGKAFLRYDNTGVLLESIFSSDFFKKIIMKISTYSYNSKYAYVSKISHPKF